MSSDHDVSRRRFLSAAVTSTAASLLARPARSLGLGPMVAGASRPSPSEIDAAPATLLPW